MMLALYTVELDIYISLGILLSSRVPLTLFTLYNGRGLNGPLAK